MPDGWQPAEPSAHLVGDEAVEWHYLSRSGCVLAVVYVWHAELGLYHAWVPSSPRCCGRDLMTANRLDLCQAACEDELERHRKAAPRSRG